MKSFRYLLLTVIAVALFASCDDTKEDDSKVVDSVQLSVSFKTPDLDNLWGSDWKNDWLYDWDSSDTLYGPLGYSVPEMIKATVYNIDSKTGKRVNSFLKLFDFKGSSVSLPAGCAYDMLFYNLGTEKVKFDASDDYQNYTASSDKPDSAYIYFNTSDELLGAMVTGVDFSKASSDSDKIDVDLEPYSIIYLFQVVILNNTDSTGNRRFIGAKDIIVTDLAKGVNMFTRQTIPAGIVISTQDIKPIQNHSGLRLSDGTTVENADILAARILSWGLPGIAPAGRIDNNYIAIDFTLSNGLPFAITKNITELLHNKPAGGVITVYVDAGEYVYAF